MEGVKSVDSFFEYRRDATGQLGLSTHQKTMAALKMLTTGCSADACEDYPRVSESTAAKSLKHFCKAVIAIFGEEYLRSPNEDDVKRLFEENAERGFPGMLGSLDCTHWYWKNCPNAFKGQYQGKEGKPTVVLEAVASYDLWIWHAYFGCPGALNDINILQRSPIFNQFANAEIPSLEYKVVSNTYTTGYYLADGIYPNYATLIKTIRRPQNAKEQVS
jgi:hypothetical protein